MNWKIKSCLSLVALIVILSAITPIPGQCYSYDSFSQPKGVEYLYIVTNSENPSTNALLQQLVICPFANAVGDQIRIRIQKANTTKLSEIRYDTLYGRLDNSSISNPVWDAMTSDYTLLAAFNRTVQWLTTPWSPFIIPRNTTAVNAVLSQWLTTDWNFQTIFSSGVYYGEWSGWNGSSYGELNQPKMSFSFSFLGELTLWRIYNGTGLGWDLIYSLELIPKTLVPQPNDEYVWEVTVSENPQVNPLAPNVGDQLKMQVLVNNWTLIPPAVYQTVYGLVFNCSATNQTWVLLTESLALIGSYSYSDSIILNEWNPYIVPHDFSGLIAVIGILTPYPPYNSHGGSSLGDAYAYNGTGNGEPGTIMARYQFTTDGVLLYWRFYIGSDDGWHLVYSLDLQQDVIPGYELNYVLLGILVAAFFYLLVNVRRSRKLTLAL